MFKFKKSLLALAGPLALVGVMLTALALPVTAGSASATRTETTSLMLRLDGAYVVNDGVQSEVVDVVGRVHLVVQVDLLPPNPFLPPNPVRVHTNLVGVRGVGRTTGARYVATGAQSFAFESALPTQLSFIGVYRLFPTDPLRPGAEGFAFPIAYVLGLDSAGQVTEASAQIAVIEGGFTE
jgi:hypothetical protein